MEFTQTVLLASIDQALASLRAALAAGADPEQTSEARMALSAQAAGDLARLPADDPDGAWEGVPAAVFQAIGEVKRIALDGGLEDAERGLAAARELLGVRPG